MNTSPIIRWILALAIVIVLNLFFNFGIKLVYDEPKFDQFCKQEQVTINPTDAQSCVARGGAWNDGAGYQAVEPGPKMVKTPGYCDLNFTCQKEFTAASQVYNRNVFVALVVLGIIAFLIGFFLATYSAVSIGLSLGGVLSFVIGTIRYWSDMDDYLRVIILGLALVALIWLGVKKLKN